MRTSSTTGRRPILRRPIVVVLFVSLVVIVLVREVVVQSFMIPTQSMEPTLRVGDRVLVSRWAYRNAEVQRGDVVVFDGSGIFTSSTRASNDVVAGVRRLAEAVGLPSGRRPFAKRVIGMPGERVSCCDDQGRITVDGVPLDEGWVAPGQAPSTVEFDIVVPDGRLWVMGDNRANSADSRAHLGDPGGGTVPLDRIVGRVVAVYWPLSRFGSTTDDEERS